MPSPQIPSALVARPERVVRPRDLGGLYANPRKELARLTGQGVAIPIARGYYVIVPPESIGQRNWRPAIEALSLGVGVADYGATHVALMGPSAARIHGAIPRAVAVGSVAVPKQRPPLDTRWGSIVFHRRVVGRLDLERVDTELVRGYQTTVEQTLLDLARWGDAWNVSADMIVEAVRTLAGRADWSLVRDLALEQGERLAYVRATRVAGPSAEGAPTIQFRGRVSPKGLLSSDPADDVAIER